MVCLGFIKLTRRGDELPGGYVLTTAGEDLLISLDIPYFRCIADWGVGAKGRFEPVWRNAIEFSEMERVRAVLTFYQQIRMERKNNSVDKVT